MLAACVPGAFGGWLLLLEEFGTWRLEDVLAFAIGYAEEGFPVVGGMRLSIERQADLLGAAVEAFDRGPRAHRHDDQQQRQREPGDRRQ